MGEWVDFIYFQKTNGDLTKQKDMLLEICTKIVEQTKLLMKSLPATSGMRVDQQSACLDDLSL
jgi:hypothetical protein